MKRLCYFLVGLAIISSCSKKSGTNANGNPNLLPDTLSAGWSKLNTLPAENFSDIFFVDNSTGYAVSNNGAYKTVNGGTDWNKVNSGTGFLNIGAGGSNRVCFLNNSATLFISQDGGSTFTSPTYPNPGGGNPGFLDCTYAGNDTVFFSSNEYIWKSVNGGTSIDTAHKFASTSSVSNLFFLDGHEGWMMRLEGLYHTTTAGSEWNLDTALNSSYGTPWFLDSNNGYYSNYGTINKTTDGGVTWTRVFESSIQSFADIDFINTNEGYFSLRNKIYKTTDGGSTWTIVAALGNEFIARISFTDAQHGWACTSDGTILRYSE